MTTNSSEPYLECPVCTELYKDPKLLPCTHLVCGKCIVTWLKNEGPGAGCPLCRAVIFPSGVHADIGTQVDALPTDLAIQSVVENHSLLNSPDVCGVCDGGKVAASSYCLQCSMKLCSTCSKGHARIPSLKSHVIEDLGTLTPQRLAKVCHMTCTRHADRLVELFCSAHQELICLLCFPTSHRECTDVRAIADVAHQKRMELKIKADSLLKEEAQMASQIQASKDDFQSLRQKVNAVFDELDEALRNRRQAILDSIKTDETAKGASLLAKEKNRASFKAHAATIANLAQSAPNDALLGMLGKLTSRLTDLMELTMTAKNDNTEAMIDVTFENAELMKLKKTINNFGQIGQRERDRLSGSTSSATDGGAKVATTCSGKLTPKASTRPVFQKGDRVMLHWDAEIPGTVVSINRASYVYVQWDNDDLPCLHFINELHPLSPSS